MTLNKQERREKVEAFRTARAHLAQLREQHSTIAKDFFLDEAQRLFEENPALIDFGWRQYTPYFNDGDSCTFSARTDDPMVNGTWKYEDYEPDDDEEAAYPAMSEKELDALRDKVSEFLLQFEDSELEAFFGDHMEVTVTREGVETNEYSHD